MDSLLTGLRAAGESTRLRLVFILSHGEFNVTELTGILGQSQPRVSRHLKLMSDAGLLERYKEGSWVTFRLGQSGIQGELARVIAGLLGANDPLLQGDYKRLNEVLAERREKAEAYFSANAAQWDQIRSLHVAEVEVEAAIAELAGDLKPGLLLDLGTGTGRILSLLAGKAQSAIGIDSSRAMLAVARANIEQAGLDNVQVRHGDIYSLPYEDAAADLITVHQVLHFLDDPGKAVAEASRVLKTGGHLLIADFAPHELEFLRDEHAHRRLGIAARTMESWLHRAGLNLVEHELLAPVAKGGDTGLTVSLWLAQKT